MSATDPTEVEVYAALLAAASPTGGATAANQTAEATLTGSVTEAAPATDTASSGLNGRLQRIAQRLTTLTAIFSAPIAVSQPGLSGGILPTWTAVTGAPPVSTIATVSKAAAAVVTTTANHGLRSGETVVIAGGNSTVSIDGARVVTVTGLTTFTVPVDTSGGASGGTAGTVSTPATPVPVPLAGRAAMLLQMWEGNTLPVFLGGSSAVTARVLGATPATTDGCPYLLAGQSFPISLADAVVLYARATAAGQYVGTCEVAA